MQTNAIPMKVNSKTGKGRPKAPIEQRKVLSDRPHRGRITPPDIPTGEFLNPGKLPEKPPIKLHKYEMECWNRIVESQRAVEAGAWIFRSDCEFLIATCIIYGRLRQVREEIDQLKSEKIPFLDPETGRANPLIAIEKSLAVAYQQGLKELAMVPSRRQVTPDNDDEIEDDGLA